MTGCCSKKGDSCTKDPSCVSRKLCSKHTGLSSSSSSGTKNLCSHTNPKHMAGLWCWQPCGFALPTGVAAAGTRRGLVSLLSNVTLSPSPSPTLTLTHPRGGAPTPTHRLLHAKRQGVLKGLVLLHEETMQQAHPGGPSWLRTSSISSQGRDKR